MLLNRTVSLKTGIISTFLFCTLLLVSQITYAQDWSFAVGPGITQYYGDVNQKQVGEIGWALNGEAWYRLTDDIQIKSGMSFYRIGSQDADTARMRSFKASNFEFYTSGMYYFKRGYFTPFVYAGVGATTNNPMGESRLGYWNLKEVQPEGEEIPGLVGFIPFGLGLEYEITPVLALVLDLSLRYTFTDQLDAVSKPEVVVNELSPMAIDYYESLSDGIARQVDENATLLGGSPDANDMYSMFSVKVKFTPTSSLFGCIDPYKYARPKKRHNKRKNNFDPI